MMVYPHLQLSRSCHRLFLASELNLSTWTRELTRRRHLQNLLRLFNKSLTLHKKSETTMGSEDVEDPMTLLLACHSEWNFISRELSLRSGSGEFLVSRSPSTGPPRSQRWPEVCSISIEKFFFVRRWYTSHDEMKKSEKFPRAPAKFRLFAEVFSLIIDHIAVVRCGMASWERCCCVHIERKLLRHFWTDRPASATQRIKRSLGPIVKVSEEK